MMRVRIKPQFGPTGEYDVDILKKDGTVYITVTELNDNPGRSVTNAWEDIAPTLLKMVSAEGEPPKVRWFEKYEGRDGVLDEVTFEEHFSNPRWRRVK
jgi:hypothetical protein